jgi:L-threonylcarbamoyladenylate synthase
MAEPTLDRGALASALAVLRAEGCVAYPTETVWGLGGCARSSAAVGAVRTWKGRADTKPISILVADRTSLVENGFEVSAEVEALIDAFWPGPLTLVLRTTAGFPPGVANHHGGVGVRCSSHPVAAALATEAASQGLGPITATSLNRSGERAAQTFGDARRLCDEERGDAAARLRPHLLDPGARDASGQAPSTVLDLLGDAPWLLRAGGVGVDALAGVIGEDRLISGEGSGA